jgi:hypothetical protein
LDIELEKNLLPATWRSFIHIEERVRKGADFNISLRKQYL